MINSIRFSQKFSGSLTIELLPEHIDGAVRELAALTVPAVDQGDAFFIVDDTYVAEVQAFIANVKKPRAPAYVRFDEDGQMVEAPKDAESSEEPEGLNSWRPA